MYRGEGVRKLKEKNNKIFGNLIQLLITNHSVICPSKKVNCDETFLKTEN